MEQALGVHRLQFAFTVTFHYIFPQLTMGLALLHPLSENESIANRRRTLQPRRALLGSDLWDQLCARRRHRHSHGVSVRHELGGILEDRRRRDRANARDGRRVLIFSGVELSGIVSYSARKSSAGSATGGRRSWCGWVPGSPGTSSLPLTPGCSTRPDTRLALTAKFCSRASGRYFSTVGALAIRPHHDGRVRRPAAS